MDKFTGKEIYALLKARAEDKAFSAISAPDRHMFSEYIWQKTQWTRWYLAGYIDGALALRGIQRAEEDNTAEYQCLQHHFCLQKESEGI